MKGPGLTIPPQKSVCASLVTVTFRTGRSGTLRGCLTRSRVVVGNRLLSPLPLGERNGVLTGAAGWLSWSLLRLVLPIWRLFDGVFSYGIDRKLATGGGGAAHP